MSDRGSRTGLLLVAGIVALAAVAVGLWLFWWQPRKARGASQDQVTAWEERWEKARTCMLGAQPPAADPSDALALVELQSGSMQSNAAGCTELIGGITRPEGGGAASPEVEAAFREVEAAIPVVAKAYAFRISAGDDEIDRRVGDLGVAIAALDGAQDRLRGAAGLSPRSRPSSVAMKRLGAPVALAADGVALTAGEAQVAAGVVRQESFRATKDVLVATAPDQVRRVHTAVEAFGSVPGSTWMVAAMPARPFDTNASEFAFAVAAMPTADTVDFTAATLVIPVGSPWVPVAALGDGDARTAVLVPEHGPDPVPADAPAFRLATSTDGGKHWALGASSAPGTVTRAIADPLDGTAAITTSELGIDGEVVRFYRLDAAHPDVIPEPEVIDPDAQPLDLDRACKKGSRLWWLSGDRVATTGGATMPLSGATYDLRVLDCTADAALVEEGSMPVRYRRCARGACTEVFHGSSYAFGRAAMRDDGTVAYAAGRGAVIALWTEGTATPTYFRLPRPMTLDALVVWGGTVHALLHEPRDASRALHAVALR